MHQRAFVFGFHFRFVKLARMVSKWSLHPESFNKSKIYMYRKSIRCIVVICLKHFHLHVLMMDCCQFGESRNKRIFLYVERSLVELRWIDGELVKYNQRCKREQHLPHCISSQAFMPMRMSEFYNTIAIDTLNTVRTWVDIVCTLTHEMPMSTLKTVEFVLNSF